MLRSAKSGGRRFENGKIPLRANVVFFLNVILLPSLGDFFIKYGGGLVRVIRVRVIRVRVRFIIKAIVRINRVGVIRHRVIGIRFSNL